MSNRTKGRRRFLSHGGTALTVGLAGCVGDIRNVVDGGNTIDDGTKLVPRYDRGDEHQLKRVAVSGETVVASTIPEPEAFTEEPGSAYVFERSGGTWSQEAELALPADAPEDEFGDPVVIDGDTALVGEWYEDTEWRSGTAYAFERSDGEWEQRARLVPDAGDSEGPPSGHVHSAAIDGDTVVLGSPVDSTDTGARSGSAFVYQRTGDGWHRRVELVPDDSVSESTYGGSVALAGDTLLIGARRSDTDAGENAGAAYAFTRSNDEWAQRARLVAEDGTAGGNFGAAVALTEDAALVGASGRDTDAETAGSVVLLERAGDGDTDWSQRTELVDGSEWDCDGHAIALEGETALVGDACRSSVNVFGRSEGSWNRYATLVASDGAGRTFGNSVSLSGDTAVVADCRQDVDGGYGAAYVFAL